ncbi:MAG: cation:proton antiporter [Oscillatoriales cyanobacterium]|jgi:multicomponent Na+:H+ antiporter subunit C|nr:MAG: cation:proton antiporter [Oscillatoriales cyanobacterium]
MLEACVFFTVLCGFFGLIFKKNLVMKIIAMDVMSTGTIAYYVAAAARGGLMVPIAENPEASLTAGSYADPVPQSIVLTAIVIGFSIQSLMLVGVMKLAKDNPTLEVEAIERSYLP